MSEPAQVGRVTYAPDYNRAAFERGEVTGAPLTGNLSAGRLIAGVTLSGPTITCDGVAYTMAEVESILREWEGRKRGL